MERHGNPTTGGRKNISDTLLPERRANRADEVHSVGALEAPEARLERPALRPLAAVAGEGVRVRKVRKVQIAQILLQNRIGLRGQVTFV
jgi:hypothetical protein